MNKDLNICVCDTVSVVQKIKKGVTYIVENIVPTIKEFFGFVRELLGELHIYINGPPKEPEAFPYAHTNRIGGITCLAI